MKKLNKRLLSVLLALVLCLNNMPFSVFSVGNGQESGIVSSVNETTQQLPWDYDSMYIAQGEEKIYYLDLLATEKVEISANGLTEAAQYQWQVEHPEKDGVWINIYDGTQKDISVTIALVENVLREGDYARLRCRAYTEKYAYQSNEITVYIVSEKAADKRATKAAQRNAVMLAEENDEFVTVEIRYVKYEYVEHVDDKGVKTYVIEEVGEAYGAYVATLRSGSSLNVEVPNPVIVGFDANLILAEGQTGATMANDAVVIALSDITESVSFRVEFHPAKVNYSAYYYFQNIYDDLYVENTAVAPPRVLQGYTGDMPSEEATQLTVTGFTALFYEPDIIAGDGSTVFNVYYERNYYIMEFDCDGGYGTDTVYVRYGTYIAVANPVRSGYVFDGWDLISTDAPNNKETLGDKVKNTLPETLPDYNSAYRALWKTTNTTFTVVYWRENADDSHYSYWGSKQVRAQSSDHISATSYSSLTGVTLNETSYFTYNSAMTIAEESKRTDLASDGKVVVLGDGSTVVNVYYSRNVYTLSFDLKGNTFTTPGGGHRHTDGNCTLDLLCGITDHVHGDDCVSNLTCTIPEHTAHTAACMNCSFAEHLHGITCTLCDQNDHTHNKDCCELDEHIHGTACYTVTNGSLGSKANNSTIEALNKLTPNGNNLVTYGNYRYTNIAGTWYRVSKTDYWTSWDDVSVSFTCKTAEHTHDNVTCYCKKHVHLDSCYDCGLLEHTHLDSCYDCGLPEHTHEDACYKDVIHSHTDDCYTWTCGASAHTHTDDCYGSCTKPENYVSGQYYYINAKYNQTIGSVWPTAAEFTTYKLGSWTIGSTTMNVSKRVNMTADLCNTNANGNKTTTATPASASTTTIQTLYYMFESTNQTNGADGDNRKLLNGVYYDCDSIYTQNVYSSATNWSQKSITGMTAVSNGVKYESNNKKVFFYYNRNKFDLSFHNVNETVRTLSDLMYNYKLGTLTIDGKPASEYEPPYPSVYEPGAYEFTYWYTSPECYERTRVNWDTITMPENQLTLYAGWVPVQRNVYFHLTYDDVATNTYWQTTDRYGNPVSYPIVVQHGAVLGTTYNYIPQRTEDNDDDGRPDYTFIGWFYMDGENKKRFAPDSMEIKRDLHLFAEWQTLIDTEYYIDYVLKNEETVGGVLYQAGTVLATATEGHSTAGRTKTFTAKAGGQLLAEFSNAPLFPQVNTHSILMNADSGENRFTFEYILDPEVYYKVRYVDKVTGEVLGQTADLKTTNAIVTEKYKFFDGYVPEQFYIRKVLAADGGATSAIADNIITFYYLPNTTKEALYNIEYYKWNQLTKAYDLVQSEPGRGTIDQNISVSVDADKFTGFYYKKAKVVTYNSETSSKETESTNTTLTGKLEEYGLLFQIYYDPNQYPYVIRFIDRDNHNNILGYGMLDADGNIITENGKPKVYASINDVKNAKADFEAVLNYTAPDQITADGRIYNFLTGTSQTQSLTIRIESNPKDATTCTVNILTFYYMREVIPIEYHAVCTVPEIIGGNVSQSSDTTPQNPQGCDAMKLAGFTFMGWYYDAECNHPVPASWLSDPLPNDGVDEKSYIKPPFSQIEKGEDGKEHYYALFKPITLKITQKNMRQNDSTVYEIVRGGTVVTRVMLTGTESVTIYGIAAGDYVIREMSNWSWTYSDPAVEPANGQVTVVAGVEKEVVFDYQNRHQGACWLFSENRN